MSIASIAAAAPARSDSRSGAASPARVNTVRAWSASLWRSSGAAPSEKASSRAAIRAGSLPSETLGTASSVGTSDEQLAVADERPSVDLHGRLEDDAVEVDWDLDRATDRRRSAEGDVRGAEDLLVLEDVAGQDCLFVGADPQLGDVGPVLAVGREQLEQLRPGRAGRVGEMATAHGQGDGVLDPPNSGDRAVDDQGALATALQR